MTQIESSDLSERHVIALYHLYESTHIIPSNEDFLYQINNSSIVYLILYWLKLEHLYPQFLEEEMDLESIGLMTTDDFVYFNVDQSPLFIHYVHSLQNRQEPTDEETTESTEPKNEEKNIFRNPLQ